MLVTCFSVSLVVRHYHERRTSRAIPCLVQSSVIERIDVSGTCPQSLAAQLTAGARPAYEPPLDVAEAAGIIGASIIPFAV